MKKNTRTLSIKQNLVIEKILNFKKKQQKKYIALPAAPGSGKTTTLLSGIEAYFSQIALKKDKTVNTNNEITFFLKGYQSPKIKEEFLLEDLENPNKDTKVLILAFNKNAIDEFIKRADKTFIKQIVETEDDLGNKVFIEKDSILSLMIEASTYHSLLLKIAKPFIEKLGYIPDYSKSNFFKKDIKYINDIYNLQLKENEIKVYYDLIESFHNSPYDFKNFIKNHNELNPEKFITIDNAKKILFVINSLYEQMAKHKITMPHCFYYKMVHKYAKENPSFLNNIFKDDKGKEFDLILVDEAQDSDAIIYDLIKMSNKKAIFVGDTFQNIYGFRGTYNVFEDLKNNESKNTDFFELNESYRYGKSIAKLTSEMPKIFGHTSKTILETTGEKSEDYVHPDCLKTQDIIKFSKNLIQTNINEKKTKRETMNQIAIICRSNKKAFEIYSILKEDEILSSYVKIESGLKSKTKDFISKGILAIEDEGLKEQIIQILDNEELTFENMINNNKICSILENTEYSYLLKCKDESLKNAMLQKSTGYETITIITVHGSKGLEYENVIIANDYIKEELGIMLPEDNTSESKLSNDEINIIYTASTRAKESLFFMEGQLYTSLQSKIKECSILNSNSIAKKNLCYLKSTILPINKEGRKQEEEKVELNNNKNIFEHRNLLF